MIDEAPIHILIVEDDHDLSSVLSLYLQHHNIRSLVAHSRADAIRALHSSRFDLALLDVGLPDVSGWEVACDIKELARGLPFVFVTARGRPEDIKRGLRLGAEDYLSKPFDAEELVLRIRAILGRRACGAHDPREFAIGRFRLDASTRHLRLGEIESVLTAKECALLSTLASRPNQTWPRAEILRAVWGRDDFFLGRSMDVYTGRLRKLLHADPSVSLDTIRGVGLRLRMGTDRNSK